MEFWMVILAIAVVKFGGITILDIALMLIIEGLVILFLLLGYYLALNRDETLLK